MLPHLSGDLPVFTTDPVHMGGQPDGECRHVEALPLGFGGISEAEEVFSREAQLLPIAGKVLVHEMVGKYIMTGRYWCMRGKHRALADDLASVRVRRSLLDQFTNAFQCEEGGVALIGMPDRRRDAQCTKHTDTADTQQKFLTEAHLLIASIQSSR